MWYGAGWIALLGVFAWLFQNWPGGFWGWLRETPNGYESGSTTVRNLGLIVAGLIALPLTLWRIRVADQQAKAAQKQVETSQRQVETSQHSLLNERYQRGAEMLGREVLSVRLGGIFALGRLAREHPEEYHVQIMRLFCAFVRNPLVTKEDEKAAKLTKLVAERGVKEEEESELRLDVQEIMAAIGKRSDAQIHIEEQEQPATLGLDLRGAKLVDAYLDGAKLTNAFLFNANLARAILRDAVLVGTNLDCTVLDDADLTGANLSNVTGMTQAQLDTARAERNSPPKLDCALDVESNVPLVWSGGKGEPLPESLWMHRSRHQKSEEETTN